MFTRKKAEMAMISQATRKSRPFCVTNSSVIAVTRNPKKNRRDRPKPLLRVMGQYSAP